MTVGLAALIIGSVFFAILISFAFVALALAGAARKS